MYIHIGFYADLETINDISRNTFTFLLKEISQDKFFVGDLLSCKRLKNDDILFNKLDNFNLYQAAMNVLKINNDKLWNYINSHDNISSLVIYKSRRILEQFITINEYINYKIKIPSRFCAFLKLNNNLKLSRKQIFKKFKKYIQNNNLFDKNDQVILTPEFKRVINYNNSRDKISYDDFKTHLLDIIDNKENYIF